MISSHIHAQCDRLPVAALWTILSNINIESGHAGRATHKKLLPAHSTCNCANIILPEAAPQHTRQAVLANPVGMAIAAATAVVSNSSRSLMQGVMERRLSAATISCCCLIQPGLHSSAVYPRRSFNNTLTRSANEQQTGIAVTTHCQAAVWACNDTMRYHYAAYIIWNCMAMFMQTPSVLYSSTTNLQQLPGCMHASIHSQHVYGFK